MNARRRSSRLPIAATTALSLLAAAGLLAPSAALAQIAKSPPPEGATVHEAVIGARYEAGGFKRWFLGGGYRDVWATPIRLPVLDLDGTAGGLTPVETGGYGQTFTLEFLGGDGLEYAVRSIDKNPTRRLDSLFQGTIVARVVQDQVSAFLPTAGLIVDPLLEASGILYPRHELVVIPDDPRLGEFRADYAGMIGMLVDRPDEGPDETPGFGGSRRIVGTDAFREQLEEGACDRVDAREYLKARLMDMLMGDRDRHEGQWRWARYPEGDGCYVWRTIPEDRDQAFIHSDGFLMTIYRLIRPQQIKFGPEYPNLVGLTLNGWEIDRQLLVELDEADWVEVAEEIQREVTDAVIDDAVARLPEPHYALRGPWIASSLKSRRERLVEEGLRYYRLISEEAEIKGTDRDEHAVFEHLADGDLRVTISYRGGPRSDRPYFERTFRRAHTDEVRLYLQGGDDLVEVRGASGRIKVRAIGGGGDDRFVNASGAGGGLTRFYDDRGDNQVEGRVRYDQRPFERPPATNLVHRNALDWGGVNRYIPMLGYNPDLGLRAGLLVGFQRYGFRKVPWQSDNAFQAGLASIGPEFFLAWDGRYRTVLWNADLVFHAEYSGLNILRFYGFGNETPGGGNNSFFKVEQRELIFGPGLEWSWGRQAPREQEIDVQRFRPTAKLGFGPVVKYADTPPGDNADRFIGSLDPAPLGVGGFGQLGGQVWFELDGRNSSAYPTSGFHLQASGAAFPALWDAEEAFGRLEGTAALYLTPGGARRAPTLALRAGGANVFGTFPFHEAAYLGGGSDLRGFYKERFAGDAVAFGNAEIRQPLARFYLLFPTEFGILGAADIGRVFFDGDPDAADTWHTAFGGGVWFSFLNRSQSLSATVVNGDDLTGVYVRAGLHF